MNPWPTLIRRELWENRSLWIAPLSAASFMVISAGVSLNAMKFDGFPIRGDFGANALNASVWGIAALILLVGSVAVMSYLLDCLYAERKDRSILFWKSLPVSDEQTVLAKFVVAMVVVPLATYLLAVATHLICSSLLLLRQGGADFLAQTWGQGNWFQAQGTLLGHILLSLLWYSPIAGYLMLASVFARRAPMLTAVLPPLVLALGERLVMNTSYIGRFLLQRMTPVFKQVDLASPELWIGVVVAAALLYVVVRLRRYRDDT